ncbi:MAG: hypothetical protein K6U80_11745 [Firmicutes bacterium]|nr:hypothetical protein [Bacillota bacterium]
MAKKAVKTIQRLSLAFKIMAGLMFFAGLMGFLLNSLIAVLARYSPLGPDSLFEQSKALSLIIKNFGGLAALQVAVSVFIFYASVQFSKFQAWARNFFELLAWSLLLLNIGVGIFIGAFSSSEIPQFVKSMAVVNTVFWAIPLLILIWSLRKKEVRAHFGGSGGDGFRQ